MYTNVAVRGDYVYYREVVHNEHRSGRDQYHPTLFVSSKKETNYQTLDGKCVAPVKPGTIRECRDYFAKYENVEGFNVYGNDRYVYQWISDNYPGEVDWDLNSLKIWTIDIEVASENGFPTVEESAEEILCITVKDFISKEIKHKRKTELQTSQSFRNFASLRLPVLLFFSKRCMISSKSVD